MSTQTLYVDSDGALTTGWRAEGGDYTRISETTADGDTTSLYTPLQDAIASFGIQNTSGLGSATINSLTVHAVIKRIDPPPATLRLGFYVGSTEYYNASDLDTTVDGAYEDLFATFTTNPATSAAWTAGDIDSAQVLIKKTNLGNAYRLTQMYAVVDYTSGGGGISNKQYLGFL